MNMYIEFGVASGVVFEAGIQDTINLYASPPLFHVQTLY